MEKIEILNSFLSSNKIQAKCISLAKEGCVDVYDLETENSFRLNKFLNLSQELMLTLKSFTVPSVKINFDKGVLQLETVSERIQVSSLVDDLASEFARTGENLPMVLGTTLKGNKVIVDIVKNPHLLIGGTTGSGKSSLLHNIISNIFVNTDATIYMVDTKAIEFSMYSKFSNRCRITDNYKEFKDLLEYLIYIMERRYQFIKDRTHISLIENSHFKPIILVIDEFADLALQDKNKEAYNLLCRLVQKCRASGIYCILATQRPSADIITGVIKANFPARIACRVASKTDSRIILDSNGAESLTNIGEAIIKNYKYDMERFQVSYSPVKEIFKFLNEKMASNT